MYWIDYSENAEDQLLALPRAVMDAVGDALAAVSVDPWGYGLAPGAEVDRSKPYRCIPFEGGQIWCLVHDRDEEIYVTDVQWVG